MSTSSSPIPAVPSAQKRDVNGAEVHASGHRNDVDFGVVVGIGDYQHIQSLHGAANDATDFRDWLCEPDGGGLDPAHVELVLSNPDATVPEQRHIDDKLVTVLEAAAAQGGARRLYFYFSGHGAMNPTRSANDVALLLARWSNSLVRLALSTERYSSKLCGAGCFKEVAMFVDCCRSFKVSPIGVEPLFEHTAGPTGCATRNFLAYACEAGHSAFESAESGRCQGFFTRQLLAVLRG